MSKFKQNETVKTIMTTNPDTLSSGSKISEAASLFRDKGYHHIPITSGSKLLGMFSFSDFLRINFSDSFDQDEREVLAILDSTKSLTDVMTREVETVKENFTIKEAAKILSSGRYHSLPVVDGEKQLVGIVTSTDIMGYLAHL